MTQYSKYSFTLSIHTFLAEGDVSNNSIYVVLSISIHTFLVEGDDVQYQITELTKISIHTFLTEGDSCGSRRGSRPRNFNPHLPYGRWRSICPMRRRNGDFNPHLPCRRWQQACSCTLHISRISIHTFLAEGDGSRMSVWRAIPNFNPHLLCRRWRLANCIFNWAIKISIHTFLAEGDGPASTPCQWQKNFNPHLPCGRWRHSWPRSSPHRQFQSTPSLRKVTRAHNMDLGMWGKFQSTPSLRKVTIKISSTIWEYGISIHTFLAEGDNFNVFSSSNDSYFNPHLPCGRWHASGTIGITLPDFNPHLPCGRWLLLSAMAISASDFNPHLPCGRWRSGRIDRRCRDCTFQSTPSLRKVTIWPYWPSLSWLYISIHTFLAEGDHTACGYLQL